MNSKSKIKQGLAIAATSALVFTFAQLTSAEKPATESIPAWAAHEISEWKELGLLKGNQNGLVLPYQTVTRADFVAFVNRSLNFTKTSAATFSDVPSGSWYAIEISKAAAAGLVSADASGKMNPLEKLTREKAAVILSKAAGLTAPKGKVAPFVDDKLISASAKQAIYALKEAGFVSGGTDGKFDGGRLLNRAEAIKMINNVFTKLTVQYTYEDVLKGFGDKGAQGDVKQYLSFLQDPSYQPSIANPGVKMPNLPNANTFVSNDFDAKPSIFASMPGVNTSVLTKSRQTLWIGTNDGVTKVNLSTNDMIGFTKENKQLSDNHVLLLISDGKDGVYAITDTGVSHIR